jgi:PTH1 family peptidyl-tRNA hydrolase
MTASELAHEGGARFRKVRFLPAEMAELTVGEERVLLVRSTRFMNESGPSYASLARKRGIGAGHVIAIHDDLDLAPGALRVKLGGGTAGHNGLRSLQQALGTSEFFRVRVGIGRPPGRQDPAAFVLEPMPKRVLDDHSVFVGEAAEAVRSLVIKGLAKTQDRFNRGAPRS